MISFLLFNVANIFVLNFCFFTNQPTKKKVTKGVVDLFEDLRDGNNLISLLEVLSGETLPREKGKLRVHHLQNVRTCLKFLENRKVSFSENFLLFPENFFKKKNN